MKIMLPMKTEALSKIEEEGGAANPIGTNKKDETTVRIENAVKLEEKIKKEYNTIIELPDGELKKQLLELYESLLKFINACKEEEVITESDIETFDINLSEFIAKILAIEKPSTPKKKKKRRGKQGNKGINSLDSGKANDTEAVSAEYDGSQGDEDIIFTTPASAESRIKATQILDEYKKDLQGDIKKLKEKKHI
jgi:hypothetical protein